MINLELFVLGSHIKKKPKFSVRAAKKKHRKHQEIKIYKSQVASEANAAETKVYFLHSAI